tara:strand:- start:485 stop:763 length:279 start_codon:yes stop_codon:yes gene_type:complete
MPTYDYQCEKCGNTFEETLKIADRNTPCEVPCKQDIQQTNHMSIKCGGEIKQIIVAPYFGYDNIKTKHSKKEPGWFREKMQEIKRTVPGNTL